MTNILLFILIALLLILSFQDLKNRLISVYLLLFITIINLAYWYLEVFNFKQILYNLIFLFFNFSLLKIYTILVKKEKTDDLIYGLGLGDILFFVAITPLFSTINFIIFFISGLIVSLLSHTIISFYHKSETIPLAGFLSLYLIGFIFFIKITNKDFYIDLIHLNI